MSLSFSKVGIAFGLLSLTLYARQSQTVSQGVYTDAQAKRGQMIYQEKCA